MNNKINVLIVVLSIAVYVLSQYGGNLSGLFGTSFSTENAIVTAYHDKQSDVQIKGRGVVKKVLADDTKGRRHQRFILQISPEQTVLVAHNIDLADRLPGLKRGETVEFYGEYEWTDKGGVLHWTHHDPRGRHINGWLKYNGKTYQ